MRSLLSVVILCLCSTVALTAETAKDKKKEAPKPINKVCPVEGGEVDAATVVDYKGKLIGFCCAGCDVEFKKDPAKYMAVVDKELKETEKKEKEAKDKDKKKGEEKDKKPELNKKCPVTDDDADVKLTHEHKGRTIAFCCDGCVDDFKKDPKKFMAKLEKQDKEAKDKEKKDAEKKKDENPAK
jgi:YHS domain-containing protein